jgi:hypothetical protein
VRRAGESTGPQLGDAVAERLLLRGAEKDSTVWDSYRRDDGTWEIILTFRADAMARQARWTYDPPRRLVQPCDDEARALIGESPALTAEPTHPFVPRIARLPGADRGMGMRPHAPERPSIERLSLERPERVERVDRVERAPEPAASASASAASAVSASVADQLDSVDFLDVVPTALPSVLPEESTLTAAEAEIPPAAAAAGAGAAYADVLMPRMATPHRDRLIGSTDRQAEADGVRPGRRAAVPSWDEIVFGTRRKKQD